MTPEQQEIWNKAKRLLQQANGLILDELSDNVSHDEQCRFERISDLITYDILDGEI